MKLKSVKIKVKHHVKDAGSEILCFTLDAASFVKIQQAVVPDHIVIMSGEIGREAMK